MAKDWEPFHEEIQVLYCVENKPLSEVMRVIKGRHGFIASERSYRTQLRTWGYMKYNTQAFPKPNRSSRPSKRSNFRPSTISTIGGNRPLRSDNATDVTTLSSVESGGNIAYFGRGNPVTHTSIPQYLDFTHDISTSIPFTFDPNTQDNDGKTQLHRAVIEQNKQQVEELLAAGNPVGVKDNFGNEPLHYGVAALNLDIVTLLLRFGADANGTGPLGRSLLHIAVSNGNADVVNALLMGGADTKCLDEMGDTALHLAMLLPFHKDHGSPILDAFLQRRCDFNVVNNAGVTPFQKLLDQPYLNGEILRYISSALNSGGSVTKLFVDGRMPLAVFLSRSDKRWAKDINGNRYFGSSEVDTAMRQFLQKGASPMTPTTSGEPLISYSLRSSTHESLITLLCESLTPEEATSNGNSVLHALAVHCCAGNWWSHRVKDIFTKSIESLLQKGVDPNTRNELGQTVMLLVFVKTSRTQNQFAEAIASMLAHGADPWLQDSAGTCALFEAARASSRYCQQFLHPIFQADIQWRCPSSWPLETRDEASHRYRWDGWEQAILADDWQAAKRLIFLGHDSLPKDIAKKLKECAGGVLAEKHLELAKNKFEGEADEIERRRRHSAEIIRDCRALKITLDMRYFDELLDLCVWYS